MGNKRTAAWLALPCSGEPCKRQTGPSGRRMLGGFIARATSSPGAGPMSASAFDRGIMIIALYIAAGAIMAVGTLYLAWRSRDFRKFLAGAFFVASGTLFYLYLADVSVPLLGTTFVETSQISGVRSIIHFILFIGLFLLWFR
jgi:hypothetical protein